MSVDYARTGDVRLEGTCDPRTRLVQEKFFSLRPKPLERWLWSRRVSAAAERVFWFHWTEGARNGDWCSHAALHFVAEHCGVDVSTVTRAYQTLKRHGLIRRIDPGRDPANPFQQATAVTEVLLPRDLVAALGSFPNRPRPQSLAPAVPVPPRNACPDPIHKPSNPYAHLNRQEHRARIQSLASEMSEPERQRWHKAICATEPSLVFDADTRVPAEIQAEIGAYLAYLATREPPQASPASPARLKLTAPAARRLSVFDLARLRRGLQTVAGLPDLAETTRQVLWAIEEGALRKFSPAHAVNIALKKLRQQEWSRPHKMPPNWARPMSDRP